MSDLWQLLWNVFVIFAFIAYLMILLSIFSDLFRDRELGGGFKVLWFIFLIAAPFLAAFIYLIARGKGMAERQNAAAIAAREATDSYIRQAAGTGPASEIAQAKSLFEAGSISEDEYNKLKAKALA